MGLSHRVIPVVLCRGRLQVKGRQFNSWRNVGMADQAVKIHSLRGVDELVLLDIDATAQNRGPDLEMVRSLADACFMPLSVGGGIKSYDDAMKLFDAGADKVVVCSGGPGVINEISRRIGCQAVVAAVDVGVGLANAYMPFTHSGKTWTNFGVDDWIRWCIDAGAGEILLTRCEYEGEMSGYDIELIDRVSQNISVPLIAHGGAGTYEHMRRAIETGADAVAAGSMFLFTDQTPAGAARYLADHGIETRITGAA